jgi:phosphatidylglycerol lysyltransferase
LAYHTPVSLGTVLVGYAVGILFWMIPITPQGVGIVESAMTLTFISLGVPGGTAAAITLAFRGLIFWLPVVVGFVLIRGVKTFEGGLGRSTRAPGQVTEAERRLARQIVLSHGRTSQAHLALLDDKTYYFSPGGSMVPYAVCGHTAVTLGDPIGPFKDAEHAIQAFLNHCGQNDWKVVFCMVEADYVDIYQRAGYTSMCLGQEGVVDLHSFTLKGNTHKTLRKRFNRLTHAGFRLVVCEPPIQDAILGQLRGVSDEWLEMTRAAEMRFFLARFDEEYLRRERLALVYTPAGEISAFVSLVPEYQRNGLSIDLMRHRQKFESGTMDFLFTSLLFWGREHGYTTFNLGLSPLFGVNTQPHPSVMDPILHLIYKFGSFYNFRGINGFKAKFRPDWTPLYMIFPGYASLLGTGLAVAKINAAQGETLWKYFKSRSRRVQHEATENVSQMITDT